MKKTSLLLQTIVFGIASNGFFLPHMALAGEVEAEIIAVQAGLLAPSGFGGGKGELPQGLLRHSHDLGDWASGTGVLLRTKPPEGTKLALKEFKLASFTDDGGKDLTKAPEGMQTERFGRDFKPVTAAYDEKNDELYIAVRSRRAPSRKATMVQGEVLIAVDGGSQLSESALFNPSSGSEVKAEPFILEIGYYGTPRQDRNQQWGGPSGMPTPTPPPAGTKDFSYSIRNISSDKKSEENRTLKVVAVELLNANGKQIFKHDNFDFESGGSYGTQFPDAPPFKFRVTTVDMAKMQSYPLTFKTTIGVSE